MRAMARHGCRAKAGRPGGASGRAVAPRARGRGAWLAALGAAAGVGIVGLVVARPFWWGGAQAMALAPQSQAGPPPHEPSPQDAARAGATPPAGPAEGSAPPAPQAEAEGPTSPADIAMREETFGVARRLVEDFPGDANALGLMGTVQNRYGNTAEAVTWWQKCLEADPRRADAYHGMAMVARRKGEYQEALRFWRQAQEIDPALVGMHGRCAEVLLEVGKPEEAIAAAEKEMAINPGDVETCLLLGKAHLQLKEHEKAAADFETARRLKPDDSRSYLGLATVCARLGQADKAKAYTEQFREFRAEEDKVSVDRKRMASSRAWAADVLSQTHTDAGRLYAAHRNLEKAEEHWRRAAAVDPRNRICRQYLVDMYMRIGRDRQALTFCEQLRDIDPKNPTYHLNTGALLARLERLDAAEEAVRKAIALAPERPTGYRSLVRLLLFRKQGLPEAKALAQRLVELEPTAPNYGLLCEACRLSGDLAGARAALERAMRLDPGDEQFKSAYKQLP